MKTSRMRLLGVMGSVLLLRHGGCAHIRSLPTYLALRHRPYSRSASGAMLS